MMIQTGLQQLVVKGTVSSKSRLIKELYKSELRMKGGEYLLYDGTSSGNISEKLLLHSNK